jgi:hypothetical protein
MSKFGFAELSCHRSDVASFRSQFQGMGGAGGPPGMGMGKQFRRIISENLI